MRTRSGAHGGFVARAVEHELERYLLDDYLRELDESFGPVSDDLIKRYDQQWPS